MMTDRLSLATFKNFRIPDRMAERMQQVAADGVVDDVITTPTGDPELMKLDVEAGYSPSVVDTEANAHMGSKDSSPSLEEAASDAPGPTSDSQPNDEALKASEERPGTSAARRPTAGAGAGSTDPLKDWSVLRAEFEELYFNTEEDPYLQEAVYAFDVLPPHLQNAGCSEHEDIKAILRNVGGGFSFHEMYNEWLTLQEHKSQLIAAIRGLFSRQNGKLGLGRFKMGGNGDVKEIVFVPKGVTATPEQISSVMGPKRWKMTNPDLMVAFDIGMRHPSSLMTERHCEHAALKSWLTAADTQAASIVGQFDTDAAAKQKKEVTMAQMGIVLYDRLSTIVGEILTAACMSNNWILVDRRTATSASPSAELLLEQVIPMLGNTKPSVIVMDTLPRWDSFKPSREVIKSLLIVGDLVSASVGADETPGVGNIRPIYDRAAFDRWEPYHLRDEMKARSDEVLQQEGDRRLPRAPEALVIKTDASGYPLKTTDGRPLVTPQLKWVYHYRQYFYQSGSHYIFFEDALTSSFEPDVPRANIFAHGSNLAFDRVMHSMKMCVPTVLLHNSGGTTQAFASLYKKVINKGNHFQEDELTLTKDLLASVQKDDIVAAEPWTQRFGPNIVEMMLRLEKRAPAAIRRSVVIVDVLKDDSEDVIEKVTGCFAAGTGGLPELGLGTAEEDTVTQAWHSCLVFHVNAQRLRARADTLYYLSMIIALLSSILIVVEMNPVPFAESLSATALAVTKPCLAVLPVGATVVGAIMSQRRYMQKWAVLLQASVCIVSEIYLFRTSSGDYDECNKKQASDEGGEGAEGSEGAAAAAGPSKTPRERFMERYEEIYQFAMLHIGADSMHYPSYLGSMAPPPDTKMRTDFFESVRSFIRNTLYKGSNIEQGGNQSGWCCKRSIPATARYEKSQIVPVKDEPELVDDLVGAMPVEVYLECRVKPVLATTRNAVPGLARRLSLFEVVAILVSAASTLLVVMLDSTWKHWIAVTVTLTTVLNSICQHEMLSQRLVANNLLLQEVQHTQSKMASVSVVVRRKRSVKGACVEAVEKACLSATTAWTGITIPSQNSGDGSAEEGEKKEQ